MDMVRAVLLAAIIPLISCATVRAAQVPDKPPAMDAVPGKKPCDKPSADFSNELGIIRTSFLEIKAWRHISRDEGWIRKPVEWRFYTVAFVNHKYRLGFGSSLLDLIYLGPQTKFKTLFPLEAHFMPFTTDNYFGGFLAWDIYCSMAWNTPMRKNDRSHSSPGWPANLLVSPLCYSAGVDIGPLVRFPVSTYASFETRWIRPQESGGLTYTRRERITLLGVKFLLGGTMPVVKAAEKDEIRQNQQEI